MSATGEEAADPPQLLDELRRNPRPSVSRAAVAARYPGWGIATMVLLVVGLVAGYVSFGPLGAAITVCRSAPTRLVCTPGVHATAVALPVAALIVGLAISLIGGRLVLKLGRTPLVAAWVGWAVFLAGLVAAFVLAGLL